MWHRVCPHTAALAIIWACETYDILIDQCEFVVETDHGSLQWLMNTKTPGRLMRWALRLQGYMPFMTIKYKPGVDNGAADALSRCPLRSGVVEVCLCQGLDAAHCNGLWD